MFCNLRAVHKDPFVSSYQRLLMGYSRYLVQIDEFHHTSALFVSLIVS